MDVLAPKHTLTCLYYNNNYLKIHFKANKSITKPLSSTNRLHNNKYLHSAVYSLTCPESIYNMLDKLEENFEPQAFKRIWKEQLYLKFLKTPPRKSTPPFTQFALQTEFYTPHKISHNTTLKQ